MQFLHKFYFFDPSKTVNKKEIFIASAAINFLTWFNKDGQEGTMIHAATGDGVCIDGLPDIINNVSFNGMFFKCTGKIVMPLSQYADGESGGDMRKFTAWINPNNIASVFKTMPDCTEIHFRAGGVILIANRTPDFIKAMIEHNRKYEERKSGQYK